MKKRVAIFGCGMEANSLYYRMRNKGVYVDYFVDNYRTDKFWGNDVVRLSDIENVKDVFFYVSSPKYYDEIKKQLTGIGLSEFDDFVKGGCFDRKVFF